MAESPVLIPSLDAGVSCLFDPNISELETNSGCSVEI